MLIKNPYTNEVKQSPKGQETEELRKQYKALQAKGKPTTISAVVERMEILEKLNGL
jgi:acyl-CoA reductase-like NAD-dependent aldehyde dehydrogenase